MRNSTHPRRPLPRPLPFSLAALALALALPASLPAAARDLLGADAVLQRLTEAQASDVVAVDPVSELKARVRAFAGESASLAPDTAAARWLALYDAFVALPAGSLHQQTDYNDRLSLELLVESLPPPAAWDALSASLLARTEKAKTARELAPRVLGALLGPSPLTARSAVDVLTKTIAADKKLEDYERENLTETAGRITEALDALAGDADVLAAFAKELDEAQKSGAPRQNYYGSGLDVPDLVRHGGVEAAEPLLLRALRLDQEISVESEGTRRLAAKLALREIDSIKKPSWSLVRSLADVPLYEALAKKFPAVGRDRSRLQAETVYLLGLIADHRTEEAMRLVLSDAGRFQSASLVRFGAVFTRMQRDGHGYAVYSFLEELLTKDPTAPFWDDFITVAAQQNLAKNALALLRASHARPDLAPASAEQIRARHATALLAADEVDEGVAILRASIAQAAAAPTKPATEPEAQASASASAGGAMPSLAELKALGINITSEIAEALSGGDFNESGDSDDRSAVLSAQILSLFQIGRLLEKPELVNEALAASRALLPTLGERHAYARRNLTTEAVKTLVSLDRHAEAETLLVEELVRLQSTDKNRRHDYETNTALQALVALYHDAGRHADVLRLMDACPLWGAADLATLDASASEDSLSIAVADALLDAGRPDDARRILRRLVQDTPGRDPAYARLEKLGDPDWETFLAQASRLDRFEERPLIWLARHQLAAGRLDEAEKTIRSAIAIDPSDGEQGKGDRLRAYAVLGDILEKRGDAGQAASMRGAVAAIRLSEQADDWWAAGLLTRAVRLYEESLTKFADAYCIQSRLALRYNELGDFAKAEEHYRRAFELMPDSFGRVESHCFGCEGAFNGERAQNVAEKVFASLAEKMPDRAQVYYLFGYLRSVQDRPAEAAAHYRRAVALDPDYLNAWSKLLDISGETEVPAAEREAAALALLRLDPLGRHASADFDRVADLRKLWGAILATEKTLPKKETGGIYELAAVRARLDARKAAGDDDAEDNSYDWSSRQENLRTHLSGHSLIEPVTQFIEATLRR
ncbi:MAG: hypothetical protein H7067_18965 [Burkholderiales bacterium]|nr:hypothetical protein [Opitutaceae bacterium]